MQARPTIPCLLRVDAARETGFGHLARCLYLARAMPELGFAPVFALGLSCSEAEGRVAEAGWPCRVLPAGLEPEAEAVSLSEMAPGGAAVLDISHPAVLARPQRAAALVRALRGRFRPVALVDGLGGDALCDRAEVEADLVLTPYFGAEPGAALPGRTWLSGPEYMIFSPELAAERQARGEVPAVARRVLVTFGGSDPASDSLKALQALALLPEAHLEVRVVAGLGFDPALAKAIQAEAAASPHACEVLSAPASLAGPMAWADLALSSTGLTKYELALLGVPAIFFSSDARLADINATFARVGSGLDLGETVYVTPGSLARAVAGLLDDRARRADMARRGRALTDGAGAQRFLNELRRHRNA